MSAQTKCASHANFHESSFKVKLPSRRAKPDTTHRGLIRVTTTGGLRSDNLAAGLNTEFDTEHLASLAKALDSVSASVHSGGARARVDAPECRSTRVAMHDYLDRRLQPRRQRRFEAHMDGCAECIRAFMDIRELSWKRQGVGPASQGGQPSTARNARLRGVTA